MHEPGNPALGIQTPIPSQTLEYGRKQTHKVRHPDINKARGRRSWLTETLEIVHNNDKLKVGYHKLATAACRNNGRVGRTVERGRGA